MLHGFFSVLVYFCGTIPGLAYIARIHWIYVDARNLGDVSMCMENIFKTILVPSPCARSPG